MKKLKLMTILGTRPEIIRLSAVIRTADRYFDHVLVHTGQNYDPNLNDIFFKELELRAPDYYLDAVGGDLGETMGNIIAASYKVIQKEKPDALLVLGDTNSALSAISAKRLKVPIFHMEAGNRCWDSVSYTHLDVYKRQVSGCAGSKTSLAHMRVSMSVSPVFSMLWV